MKRLFVTILSLCAVAIAVADNSDNKLIMKAVKSNMEFTEVSVGAAVKLYVEDRTDGNIIIRATERVMPYIKLAIEDGELEIYYANTIDFKKEKDLLFPLAEIYMPTNGRIESFSATAASVVVVSPKVVVEKLKIEAIAASKITLTAECAEIDCESTGASTITINGKAAKGNIEVIGASTFNGSDLECSQLTAEVGGASKATLKAESAKLEVYGASNAAIDCSLQLNTSASGASTIRYAGDCQVNITNSSGASTIRKK